MMRTMAFLAAFAAASACQAANLTVATFNTESDDDTQPAKVAESISKIGAFDVLAVQEVESSQALKTYADAAAAALGGRWRYVISESGFNTTRAPDFLGIIYRTDTFRQLATQEIHLIRSRPDGSAYGAPDWSLRGALILRLQHIATGSEFQIATVHLKCCNEPAVRAHQAALLAKEITRDTVPTILLGDTNIPIEPGQDAPTDGNAHAFISLTNESGLTWVKPKSPVKTQCDPAFNSMLDQVYGPINLSGAAQAEIKFPEETYCDLDAQGFSDHRPIVATFPDFLLERLTMTVSEQFPMNSDRTEADNEEKEFQAQKTGRSDDSFAR